MWVMNVLARNHIQYLTFGTMPFMQQLQSAVVMQNAEEVCLWGASHET